MELKKIITKKGFIFLAVFSVLAFIGQEINFSPLIGADNQFFTLFQFFGPMAGSFLGPIVGILAVLIAEVANYFAVGREWTLINLVRLLPMLFAAYYFGTRKEKLNLLIPVLAILAFIIHPIGRQVWFFTLFWTIPVIVKLLPDKYSGNAFLRGLGATFTAHAVGGAAWIWAVQITEEQWIVLIPVVAYERLLFAGGIGVSYIIFNTLLNKLDAKYTSEAVNIDRNYVLSKRIFGISS
ncbi:hypothetical protein HYX09_00130 [Candidatus Woesearchaeota archaeon]|nr:hypothetical protein [Candidatus Woesearchaeota archaeon]